MTCHPDRLQKIAGRGAWPGRPQVSGSAACPWTTVSHRWSLSDRARHEHGAASHQGAPLQWGPADVWPCGDVGQHRGTIS